MLKIEEMGYASTSMKIPIFDGTESSKYQDWEDDMIAVFEYHDLKEYVGLDWKYKDVPEKTTSGPNKVLQRKETKKMQSNLV